jgi:hypothetical protein
VGGGTERVGLPPLRTVGVLREGEPPLRTVGTLRDVEPPLRTVGTLRDVEPPLPTVGRPLDPVAPLVPPPPRGLMTLVEGLDVGGAEVPAAEEPDPTGLRWSTGF